MSGPIAEAFVVVTADLTSIDKAVSQGIEKVGKAAAAGAETHARKITSSFASAATSSGRSMDEAGAKANSALSGIGAKAAVEGGKVADEMAKAGTGTAAGVKRGVADGENSLERLGTTAKRIGAAVVAAFGVHEVISVLGDAARSAQESAKVSAISQQIVKTTGAAAGLSAAQVGDLATRLSNLTGVDDEVVQGAENILLTFTNIKNVGANKIFDQASEAALNLSTVLGGDVNGAAVQLGKALNDPVKGMTALARSGVSFTQQQKDQVAAMVKAGDVLGAQKIILGEVNKEFGGTAAAAIDPMTRLSTIIDNLKESLGAGLLPAVSSIGTALAAVTPTLAPLLSGLGSAFGTLLGAAGPALAAVAADIGTLFTGLGPALTSLGPPLLAISQALGPVFDVLGQVIGTVVPPLAGIITTLVHAATPLLDVLASIVDQIGPALQPLFAALIPVITQVANVIGGALLVVLQAIEPVIPALAQAFSSMVLAVVPLVEAFLPLVPTLAQIIAALVPLLPLLLELSEPMILLLPLLTPIIALFAQLLNDILKPLIGPLTEVSTKVGSLSGFIEKLSPVLEHIGTVVADALDRAISAVVNFVQSIIETPSKLLVPVRAVGRFFEDLPGKIGRALEGLGEKLLHAIVDGVVGVARALPDAMGHVLEFFVTLPLNILNALLHMDEFLIRAFVAAVKALADALPGIIESVLGFFRDLPGRIVDAAISLGGTLIRWAGDALGAVIRALPGLAEGILGFFRDLPGNVIKAGEGLFDAGSHLIGRVFDGLLSIGGKAVDIAKQVANALIGVINQHVIEPVRHFKIHIPFAGDLTPFDVLPPLPTFDLGGIVDKDKLALVHKGEVIINPAQGAARARQLAGDGGLTPLLADKESAALLRRMVAIMEAGGARPIEVHLPAATPAIAVRQTANAIARAAAARR